MIENYKEFIFMDGNGLFVWFCLIFFCLVLVFNIFLAYRKKRKVLKLIKSK